MLAEKNTAEELGTKIKICHAGFSLIEVLVSMTVLVVIIVMVTGMFRDASEAWDMGTQRAEMNTAARAAVEYITRELSCAVAGSIQDSAGAIKKIKKFKIGIDENGVPNTLSFVALSGEDGVRSLRGIRFKYELHQIRACHDTGTFDPYNTSEWSSYPGVAPLITNVWRFEALVYENEDDMRTGTSKSTYDSSSHSDLLPAAVDISIEMLGDQNMARALSLGAAADGFVMTNSRVYTTRVCFPNRGGR
jgi:prepilin-type N-terminal cleavage/methylation domain-containing protein